MPANISGISDEMKKPMQFLIMLKILYMEQRQGFM
jgi:hypothetical protein